MKSDNEFEKIDQRSVCNHYALYASGTNPTWLKKKTPRLLEIQNIFEKRFSASVKFGRLRFKI